MPLFNEIVDAEVRAFQKQFGLKFTARFPHAGDGKHNKGIELTKPPGETDLKIQRLPIAYQDFQRLRGVVEDPSFEPTPTQINKLTTFLWRQPYLEGRNDPQRAADLEKRLTNATRSQDIAYGIRWPEQFNPRIGIIPFPPLCTGSSGTPSDLEIGGSLGYSQGFVDCMVDTVIHQQRAKPREVLRSDFSSATSGASTEFNPHLFVGIGESITRVGKLANFHSNLRLADGFVAFLPPSGKFSDDHLKSFRPALSTRIGGVGGNVKDLELFQFVVFEDSITHQGFLLDTLRIEPRQIDAIAYRPSEPERDQEVAGPYALVKQRLEELYENYPDRLIMYSGDQLSCLQVLKELGKGLKHPNDHPGFLVAPLLSESSGAANDWTRCLPVYRYNICSVPRPLEGLSAYLRECFSLILRNNVEQVAHRMLTCYNETIKLSEGALTGLSERAAAYLKNLYQETDPIMLGYEDRWANVMAIRFCRYAFRLNPASIETADQELNLPWKAVLKRVEQLIPVAILVATASVSDRLRLQYRHFAPYVTEVKPESIENGTFSLRDLGFFGHLLAPFAPLLYVPPNAKIDDSHIGISSAYVLDFPGSDPARTQSPQDDLRIGIFHLIPRLKEWEFLVRAPMRLSLNAIVWQNPGQEDDRILKLMRSALIGYRVPEESPENSRNERADVLRQMKPVLLRNGSAEYYLQQALPEQLKNPVRIASTSAEVYYKKFSETSSSSTLPYILCDELAALRILREFGQEERDGKRPCLLFPTMATRKPSKDEIMRICPDSAMREPHALKTLPMFYFGIGLRRGEKADRWRPILREGLRIVLSTERVRLAESIVQLARKLQELLSDYYTRTADNRPADCGDQGGLSPDELAWHWTDWSLLLQDGAYTPEDHLDSLWLSILAMAAKASKPSELAENHGQ